MLVRIAENVWGHEVELTLGGGLRLPSRATLLRLSSGELVLHSPLAVDDALAREIDALGDVRYLVAPNFVHWMFLGAAARRWPKARAFGVAGLERKAKDVRLEPLPSEGALDGAGDEVRILRVEGAPYVNEHVLLHQPSRSLVVGDLMFNVRSAEAFMTRFFLRCVGAYGRSAQSRFWRFLVRDRAAAALSAHAVLGWDFGRVVVAHGDVIEDDAREQARRALAWMTSGGARLLGAGSLA